MYGTHYSSAGVVLYYHVRQDPFTTLHINLQVYPKISALERAGRIALVSALSVTLNRITSQYERLEKAVMSTCKNFAQEMFFLCIGQPATFGRMAKSTVGMDEGFVVCREWGYEGIGVLVVEPPVCYQVPAAILPVRGEMLLEN